MNYCLEFYLFIKNVKMPMKYLGASLKTCFCIVHSNYLAILSKMLCDCMKESKSKKKYSFSSLKIIF